MMDAFDYFIVVFVYADIAKGLPHLPGQVAFLTTATLIMRPVGAIIFGLVGRRKGRRIPLLVDVSFYSVVGFLCAFAPNFTVLLILRSSTASAWVVSGPRRGRWPWRRSAKRRGLFSGILQQGYSLGYLVASLASLVVINWAGLSWRWLFALSIFPALISLLIRSRVKESEVWQDTQKRMKMTESSFRNIAFNPAILRRFGYLILLMTAFNWMSTAPGIYPTFLKATDHGGIGVSGAAASWIAVLYTIGATIGGITFGALSSNTGGANHRVLARCSACRSCRCSRTPTPSACSASARSDAGVVQGAWG